MVKILKKLIDSFVDLVPVFFLLDTSLLNPKPIHKRNITLCISEKLYHNCSDSNLAVVNILNL